LNRKLPERDRYLMACFYLAAGGDEGHWCGVGMAILLGQPLNGQDEDDILTVCHAHPELMRADSNTWSAGA
jgi:hypothetical protein